MRLAAAVLAFAVPFTMSAEVMKHADFGEGPAKHLMTKAESKQWRALRSDDEAEGFMALFWARRDPTPQTERNEFREDFEQRVRFADENFSTGRIRGAMSDQGRVFILLGPPFRVSSRAGADATGASAFGGTTAPRDAQGGVLLGRPTTESNKMYWMYAHEKKPRYISDSDFTVTFSDEGQGDWKLGFTERTNPEALLLQAVNGLIVSPRMTKVPVYVTQKPLHTTKFTNAAIETGYQALRSPAPPEARASHLAWGEFVTSDGDHFIGTQIYLPKAAELAGQNVTAFTVLETADGAIVDVHEAPATVAAAAGGDAYVESTTPVEKGTYTATIGLEAGGKLIAAQRVPLTIEGIDEQTSGVTPLILASRVYPLTTTWRPTDPFTFGGLKVVPKADAEFQTGGDLWYFVELRRPGLADTGKPYVRVQVDIRGKTSKGPVELSIPMKDASLAKLAGETTRFGLGLAIPLDGFVPGDYTIKVHVEDVILKKEYDLQKPFRVRGS